MPAAFLDMKDIAVNKTDKNPYPHEPCLLVEGDKQ